jgi:hypothetical protein
MHNVNLIHSSHKILLLYLIWEFIFLTFKKLLQWVISVNFNPFKIVEFILIVWDKNIAKKHRIKSFFICKYCSQFYLHLHAHSQTPKYCFCEETKQINLFFWFFLIFIFLLFICEYNAWVISPPCPHPLPYHPLHPLLLLPTPLIQAETILSLPLMLKQINLDWDN